MHQHTIVRKCPRCGGRFKLDFGTAHCPHCGKAVMATGATSSATAPRTFWEQEVAEMLLEFAGQPLEASIRKLAERMGIEIEEGR